MAPVAAASNGAFGNGTIGNDTVLSGTVRNDTFSNGGAPENAPFSGAEFASNSAGLARGRGRPYIGDQSNGGRDVPVRPQEDGNGNA